MTDFIKGELAGIAAVVVIVAVAIACGQLLRGTPSPRVAPDAGVAACECPIVNTDLMRDLAACREKLTEVPVAAEASTKIQVKTVRCDVDAPEIAPVVATKCAAGQSCLDASAQRALAKNLAAYEGYVRRVQACEGK